MSTVKHVVGNLITSLLIYPIGFIASVFIARYLGPADRGLAAFLVLGVGFLIPMISLGIGTGILYQVSSKRFSPVDALPNCIIIALFFGSVGFAVIYAGWYSGLFGEIGELLTTQQIFFVCFAFVFHSLYFFLTRLLMGDSKFPLLNTFKLIKGIMQPILMLTMVWFFSMKVDGVAIAIFILSCLLAIFALTSCVQTYGINYKINFRFISRCFSYGIRSWLGNLAIKANVRFDQLVLAATVAPFGLGIYSIAVVLAELIWIIPDSIGPVLFNRIAAMSNSSNRVNIVARILRLLFIPSMFIAAVLLILSKYVLIPYGYGNDYSDVVLPLSILLFGSVFFIPAKIITKIFAGSGNVIYSSYAMAIGSTVSIALYFLLIPKYEVVGAAIASSIGYAAISSVCVVIYRKQYDSSMVSLFVVKWQDVRWVRELLAGMRSQ